MATGISFNFFFPIEVDFLINNNDGQWPSILKRKINEMGKCVLIDIFLCNINI